MIIFAKMICVYGDTEGNKSLNALIHIKFQSINETRGQASVSYESTCAVLRLTEILERAVVAKRKPAKRNDKNQRPYDYMVLMYHDGIRLVVGHQKTKDEYVQYCISATKK